METVNIPGDVTLTFYSTRSEPDIDGIFLSAKENATLGPAAARSVTDFHCTGSHFAVSDLVAEKATMLTLQLGSDSYELSADRKTISISDRTRLNITASRTAVAVDGTIGTTMSGQASVSLEECFLQAKNNVAKMVKLTYANWTDISCVVQIASPQIMDTLNNRQLSNIEFVVKKDMDSACQTAETVLESVYDASVKTRNLVVFAPAPPLSKAVMRVPFGINGSTFDFSCNVVDRPPSLSRKSFESIANAVILSELGMDHTAVSRMRKDCTSPSIAATKWATKVSNSMSTIVSLCCPYRIDGVTKTSPNGGISLVAAESWKAEASRDELIMCDDCDGSAAFQTSQLYDAIQVSRSPELSNQFPTTAAFANAMAHHSIGVCILSANAGSADEAGANGEEAVAGHAIGFAVPKPDMIGALITGLRASMQDKDSLATTKKIEEFAPLWTNCLYSHLDVERMPFEERAILKSYDRLMNISTRLPDDAGFVPLAMEGTSPVSPSTLVPKDDKDRYERQRFGRLDKKVESLIGPTVSRNKTQLDVNSEGTDHVFYKELVEFLMPMRGNPMFENDDIREKGLATAQFVLTDSTDPTKAGATPENMSKRRYGLVPLWKVNKNEAEVLDVAIKESLANSMPMRNTPTGAMLNEKDADAYDRNISTLTQINRTLSIPASAIEDQREKHVVQHILPFATLVRNKHAIQTFVDRIDELDDLDAFVDVVDVPGILSTGKDGRDIGKFVCVNIEARI